jgi:hypothetical protein
MNVFKNDPTIVCPKCQAEIRLTDSLSAPILEEARKSFAAELTNKDAQLERLKRENQDQTQAFQRREKELDAEMEKRLNAARLEIAQAEAKKAQYAFDVQLKSQKDQIRELEGVVAERNDTLAKARAAEVELRRKERRLEQAKAELELSVETRVNEALAKLRVSAIKDAEDRLKLKINEKDQAIASMRIQIEELKRKAEQGSQQLQGEAQEIELESILRAKFPGDIIEPVSKGVAGGDVIQHVLGPKGQTCGTIIWESKRTKSWSDGWLTKLRNDQRGTNADAAILVSEALPKGLEAFELRHGVWVAEFRYIVPIATAIRHAIVEVALARKAEEGQQTKMEMVYRYLTGQRFQQRISAIVDQFSEMHGDLDRERRATVRLWAKREAQIRGVIEATAGMYGDLQGIAGRSLQEIEGLDHKLPPEPKKLAS